MTVDEIISRIRPTLERFADEDTEIDAQIGVEADPNEANTRLLHRPNGTATVTIRVRGGARDTP